MSSKDKKSKGHYKELRKEVPETWQGTLDSFWQQYSEETPQRVKLIDMFIMYLIMVICTQVFYRIVVGDDFPKNAFISGTFCPIGVIVLLVALRKSYGKGYRALGQFFLACLVLFVVSINFAG